MFTSVDKAIAAVLSGLLFVAASFGVEHNVSGEMIASIAAVIAGVVTYLVPNKAK